MTTSIHFKEQNKLLNIDSDKDQISADFDIGINSIIRPEFTPFSFPRGAKHGSFLHLLFELIDFQNTDKEQLSTIIAEQLTKHFYQ